MKNFQDFLKSKWFLALFLTFVSAAYDVVLFPKTVLADFSYFILFLICYYFSWFFVLHIGRFVTIFFLIINFLFFCVFKEYQQFYDFPLTVFTFISSFKEGLHAGLANGVGSLMDTKFFIFLSFLLIQIYIIWKNIKFDRKNLLKAFSCFFGSFILFISSAIIIFQVVFFEQFVETFPKHQHAFYKFYWPLKYFFSGRDYTLFYKNLSELRGKKIKMLTDDVSLSFLPDNIFLIQVESFTTNSLESMPFLSSLIKDHSLAYYIDKNHHSCYGSSNSDFMMLSGFSAGCSGFYGSVYQSHSVDIYKTTNELSSLFKNKNYKTFFLHNYTQKFFSRGEHIKKLYFDRVFFEEDFDKKYKRYIWGISDFDLFKTTLNEIDENEKNFAFIVTVGMHTPYDMVLSDDNKHLSLTEKEKYLNASHIFDQSFEYFYHKAPKDSLFILYGDHNVKEFDFFDTPFIVLYKGNKNIKLNGIKKDGFGETVYFVNSLFYTE